MPFRHIMAVPSAFVIRTVGIALHGQVPSSVCFCHCRQSAREGHLGKGSRFKCFVIFFISMIVSSERKDILNFIFFKISISNIKNILYRLILI